MANLFDQFDGQPPALGMPPTAPAVSGGDQGGGANPFDKYDGAPTAFGAPAQNTEDGAEPQASVGSMAKNFGVGLVAGLPNAESGMEHVINPLKPAIDWAYGKIGIPNPTAGELVKKGLGYLGFDPDNPDQMTQPQNAPERIARMGGEGAAMAVVPGGEAGMIPRVGGAIKNAIIGTTSGTGSEIGRELAPDQWKDVAGLVGGLLGGGVGMVGSEAPGALWSAAKGTGNYAAPMVAPYSTTIRKSLATKTLSNAAENPEAAVSAINNAPSEIVPGSSPTTFQASGDAGLGQLERAVAAKSPEDFLARRADQNNARLDALSNIEDAGHPEAVGSFFRDQLDQIDQQMQAAHDAAATSARSAVEGIGGSQGPDILGEQARTALQASQDAAKASERSLWKAVDPEGNLQVAATPLKTAFNDVYGSLGPESSIGMTPVEKQLGDVIQGYGQTLPLQRMIDLRSVVSKAMRDANSPLQANSIAYGRLSQLRGAVEDAISSTVSQRAAEDQQAVATGAMQPENTMAATLAAERSEWVARRNQQEAARSGGGGYSVGNAAGRSPAVSGPPGAEVPGAGRISDASGTTGFSPNDGGRSRFVDQDAADRLKVATAATASRKQVFGQKPVSQILQRPGATLPYNLPGGAVSSSAWKAGMGGADAVNAILKASPEAIAPLKEMAASSLRSKAQDGVLTSKQLAAWTTQHAPALKALEAASPGSTAVFENAARAGDHLAQVAQARKDALAAVEKSAVGRLLKVDDPSDVVKTIGSIFNRADAVKTMRGLAQAASRDPAAMQGLRRAVVEHMEQRLVSNTEAGTSGQNLIKPDAFQTFIGKNQTALRQVFSDQELGTMRAIAQDLKRANRSIASSKLPGQSNTPQDRAGAARFEMAPSLLSKLFTHAIGGGAGFALDGGFTGTLMGLVGSHVVSGLREAGIRSVDGLVKEAMLNPDLAKALLMKAPKKIDIGSELTLANKLKRMSLLSAAQNAGQSR